MVLKVLFLSVLTWTPASSQSLNDAKSLRRDLLDGYDKFVRPAENQTQPVDVYFYFGLVAIQDFDEVQERFSVTGVFLLNCIDENLR